MKQIIHLITLVIILILPQLIVNAQFFNDYRGVYDNATNAFYFDGRSYNAWTRYKEEYDENIVYVYRFKTDKIEKFYTASDKISELTLSPDSKLFAFIQDSITGKALLVVNKDGHLVQKIDGQVQKYAWGTESNKLYFITGKIEKRPETYSLISDGVWAYDLNTKEKVKSAEKGWNIRNVIFDNNIYFFNGDKIVRYNVYTRKVEDVDIQNTNMSSNKRYYYYYMNIEDPDVLGPPYWSPFRIFDTYANRDLPPEKILFITERRPGDVIWAKDGKTIIFRGNKERKIYRQEIFIYNIETNQLVKRFPGTIVGIDNERVNLVVLRGGKFALEPIP